MGRDSLGNFAGSRNERLKPSEQRQNDDDDQDQSQNSARAISPPGAIGPSRQRADQQQDQDDDQDGREHGGPPGRINARYYHRFPAGVSADLSRRVPDLPARTRGSARGGSCKGR